MNLIDIPVWPESSSRSNVFQVTVAGRSVPVLACGRGALCLWTGENDADVVVRCPQAPIGAVVRPRRLGIAADIRDRELRFRLPGPGRALVDIPGLPPLFLCAERAPAPAPLGARVLAAGQLHQPGLIELPAGRALWIERGAVLNAAVRARHPGARLGGGGLVTGAGLSRQFLIACDGAHEAQVSDLALIDAPAWCLVVGGSDGTRVNDLVILTPGNGAATDGIDLCGSSHVRVARCLVVSGDDAVAVKAFTRHDAVETWTDWSRAVEDVVVEDCILGTFGGHGMEIGHELTVSHVRDVTFRRIDVLFAHHFGCPIAIHVGDRATVERITWERVSIEHCYHMLLDLRIIRSRYSRDTLRGHLRDVRLSEVDWWTTPYNAGYTVSHIGGYDAEHRIGGVHLGLRIDGRPIASPDELDLHTRHADQITVG